MYLPLAKKLPKWVNKVIDWSILKPADKCVHIQFEGQYAGLFSIFFWLLNVKWTHGYLWGKSSIIRAFLPWVPRAWHIVSDVAHLIGQYWSALWLDQICATQCLQYSGCWPEKTITWCESAGGGIWITILENKGSSQVSEISINLNRTEKNTQLKSWYKHRYIHKYISLLLLNWKKC